MTLGAGEVAAVPWEYIGLGGDDGCRRRQPVSSPDRERTGVWIALRGVPFPSLKPPVRERVKTEK